MLSNCEYIVPKVLAVEFKSYQFSSQAGFTSTIYNFKSVKIFKEVDNIPALDLNASDPSIDIFKFNSNFMDENGLFLAFNNSYYDNVDQLS